MAVWQMQDLASVGFGECVKLLDMAAWMCLSAPIQLPLVWHRLERLWAGQHPVTGASLGYPQELDDPAAALQILLGAGGRV
eukprot:CAMPEP_0115470296 /NCGR_PEP_ID=MMETSP0271-20121206/51928_1 /TAXON_ID=71861 /ORGANISM="Scrippsiella trochoidea, Strain CCMP3099" /LENGTH=80 /DNA_ID=CAMNT_0002897433 /DNA_START=343 /DNA_END=584 /DNA_ORIENTATION=+